MKTVCRTNQCTGCMACVDICPKQAISVRDGLSAYNAVIDPALCVECDACVHVCQQNNEPELRTPIAWYQGWASDTEVRAAGSSGGIAGAISRGFIREGGVVCSCVFEDGDFRFRIAHTEQEAAAFAGSKYIKSTPSGIYAPIRKLLTEGTRVLFIGLPCQCAAIRRFVGNKGAEGLYTVDLICHGSPSPMMLDLFLKKHSLKRADLRQPTFREKGMFRLADGKRLFAPAGTRDCYTLMFLNTLAYTENCYACPYACTERVSDISLGDSWGSDLHPEEVALGISLVLCQSEKGQELLRAADVYLTDVDVAKAIANNHQLREPSKPPKGREAFFRGLYSGVAFNRLVFRCFPKQCFRQRVKGVLTGIRPPKKKKR